MKHVIELDDGEAAVLEETGSGGLIGRGLLHDDPLADYVETDEEPRYVVRNKRGGFAVERTDPDGSSAETVADAEPDGDHSAAALVTDTRVLFAVGRSDGDRTRSVPLADVVDVQVTDGFLGGEIVFETVADERYRFPSRGDLAPVREFVDAAAGIWARAERQLESAEDRLDRTERAFESGDVDVVLAAVPEIRETLASARETAASLDGASASVETRVASCRDRLAAAERRAYAEQADNARERGLTRWEDHAFETAYDHFERADESYAAALAIDADDPLDALIERRRASLASECERLASVPKERAEHAYDAATGAGDLASAIEWYERALERYETLHSLDWGRDERRFDGDRDAIRDQLATVAEELVQARCERARRALDLLDDAPPEAAPATRERAGDALDAAHELARERAPAALDTVERLQDALAAEGDSRLSDEGGESTAPHASDTIVVPSDEEGMGTESADADSTPPEDESVSTGSESESEHGDSEPENVVDETAPVPDTESEEWVFVDDRTDDEWVSAERTEPAATEAETGSDDSPSDPLESVSESADAESDLVESVSDAVETELQVSDDATESEADESGSAAESADPTAGDLESVRPDSFTALVLDRFVASGWTSEESPDPLSEQDFQVTTPGPVSITAAVMTVSADAAAAVDIDGVERFASAVERASAVDHAVLVAGARLPEAARNRASEREVHLVDPEGLQSTVEDRGVALPDDGSTES